MSDDSDLNQLQLELVRKGLCSREQIVEIIKTKKSQARKTRDEIEEIMKTNNCNKERAFEILGQKRREERRERSN